MLNKTKIGFYRAFGLNIISEIALPELSRFAERKVFFDTKISIGDLEKEWSLTGALINQFYIKENIIMFQIPEVAIFSIKNGKQIIVSPLSSFNEDEARLYILGTCMGAILLQRRILPLHGSAIVIDGKVYGFIGDSGAGKSTIASAFIHKGYSLLTDDVIAVTLSKHGIPVVTPSYPQQKLWQESLNQFGMDHQQFRPLVERETKYAVPVPSNFLHKSYPLAGVFEIVKTNHDEIEILPIQGVKRLETLYYHTYRNFMIAPAGLTEWHFHSLVQIVNKINLFQLNRPNSYFTAHELPDLVLQMIKKSKEETVV
ncbi:aldolase [Neobacillus niacini]|uniref:aldolase n=1 Tax=Neobacillus niacini TaxID=86668 RepID=UPI00285DBAC4|nr:aldolase [Neobacillus niacini]MDR7000632.1 hypothetical protein [Neobacillus niacini]